MALQEDHLKILSVAYVCAEIFTFMLMCFTYCRDIVMWSIW